MAVPQNSLIHRCSGPSRRAVLQLGALTGLGLGPLQLARAFENRSARSVSRDQVRADSTKAGPAKARNCILIWLDGGPSHLETFDLKPDAPAEVRGPLTGVATSVPGYAISECLPNLATRMNDVAVIRSMTSPLGEHNLGTHYLMTGYRPTPVLEYPSFPAVAALSQQQSTADAHSPTVALPPNIAVPNWRVGGAGYSGHGFLPAEFGPFSVGSDPGSKDFAVRDLTLRNGLSLERIARRRQFSEQLARLNGSGAGITPSLTQAFEMVTSSPAQAAFRLEEESMETRRRYGPKSVGQSCLLARRLIERGVSFVTVNQRGWDTHENLYTRLKEGYTGAKVGVGLIPSLDLAVSALIDDLRDRRLLDETLIVVMGEFGRTPKLNPRGGRDHWPRVFSVALAGGGVAGGQVIGESDAVGESPKDRPVRPEDLVCTIYSLLGLDPRTELQTDTGRPVRLVRDDAEAISELLG